MGRGFRTLDRVYLRMVLRILADRGISSSSCLVAVPRSSAGLFRFELAGYEPVTVDRDKVCNGLTALNLLGGWVMIPLFFGIDAVTGNIGKYSTKPVEVELKPVKSPPPPTVIPSLRFRPRWNFRRMVR
jgi:hypothetical protein